jgi:hypothetical protein
MRLMSPSAQALASIIGIPPPALAYMIGIGLRHLLVALITGGARPLTPPLILDNRLSRSMCQVRQSAYNSLSLSRSLA